MPPLRHPIDNEELRRRYLAGESERVLAASLGIARTTLRKRLDDMNIERRSKSAAQQTRWEHATPAERQAFTVPATTATRGRRRPEETVARIARAREARMATREPSTAVAVLDRALRARGFETRRSHAVGRYSGDLVIGSVVVEIIERGQSRGKRRGDRLRYLLDLGYTVIYVWMDNRRTVPLSQMATAYVVKAVETSRRRRSAVPTYAVLRHDGEIIDFGIQANADFTEIARPPRANVAEKG